MSVQTFTKTIRIERPAHEVFAWHERAGALARLTPPWERVEVVQAAASLRDGARAQLRAKAGPCWTTWEVEHRDYVVDKQFRDVQVRGPFASWAHVHRVDPQGSAACTLTDEIRYELPGGVLGEWVAGAWIKRKLERVFTYRQALTKRDVELNASYGSVRPMRFLIAGASGMLGRALTAFLSSQGHEVVRLVRRRPVGAGEIFWNPQKSELDAHKLRGVDVVVNLAGEPIASGRWTDARKAELWTSRIEATRTLVDAIERAKHRPFALINASATGLYGSRGNERLTEDSERGEGFLAELCAEWEIEAGKAEAHGVRVVALRTGVVLSPLAGALGKMLPFFKAGLGARLGDGRQWMSWISSDDLVGAIYHVVLNQNCHGPINAVAPVAVTNAEFTAALGKVLGRPTWLAMPARALKLAYGPMAREALLASTRVLPERLHEAGYVFRHETVDDALRQMLGR